MATISSRPVRPGGGDEDDSCGIKRSKAATRSSVTSVAISTTAPTGSGSYGRGMTAAQHPARTLGAVLEPNAAAVGIGMRFVHDDGKSASDGPRVDGFLAALALDWPRSDLLGNFHSGVADAAPFWPLGDAALDKALETYAASLTTATPAFKALADVHARLFALEPASILMQHKACLGAGPGLAVGRAAVNPRDPDWFRQLLL